MLDAAHGIRRAVARRQRHLAAVLPSSVMNSRGSHSITSIGAGEERWRHGDPKRLCSLSVDY